MVPRAGSFKLRLYKIAAIKIYTRPSKSSRGLVQINARTIMEGWVGNGAATPVGSDGTCWVGGVATATAMKEAALLTWTWMWQRKCREDND